MIMILEIFAFIAFLPIIVGMLISITMNIAFVLWAIILGFTTAFTSKKE